MVVRQLGSADVGRKQGLTRAVNGGGGGCKFPRDLFVCARNQKLTLTPSAPLLNKSSICMPLAYVRLYQFGITECVVRVLPVRSQVDENASPREENPQAEFMGTMGEGNQRSISVSCARSTLGT